MQDWTFVENKNVSEDALKKIAAMLREWLTEHGAPRYGVDTFVRGEVGASYSAWLDWHTPDCEDKTLKWVRSKGCELYNLVQSQIKAYGLNRVVFTSKEDDEGNGTFTINIEIPMTTRVR